MWKWILAGLGILELGFGVLSFPRNLSGQEVVTWSGLVSFLSLIVGAAMIGAFLGYYEDEIKEWIE